MSEELETTEEIRAGYAFNRYSIETAYEEFDRWYAEEIRKAKEEAWHEGRASADQEYEHIFNGHPVAEGESCGECEELNKNPYRKEENAEA